MYASSGIRRFSPAPKSLSTKTTKPSVERLLRLFLSQIGVAHSIGRGHQTTCHDTHVSCHAAAGDMSLPQVVDKPRRT
ncbi:hypothetical protein M3J09_000011 [Ascochyta lentis]